MNEIKKVIKTKMATVKVYDKYNDDIGTLDIEVTGRGKIESKVPEGYSFLKVEDYYTKKTIYSMDFETFIQNSRRQVIEEREDKE